MAGVVGRDFLKASCLSNVSAAKQPTFEGGPLGYRGCIPRITPSLKPQILRRTKTHPKPGTWCLWKQTQSSSPQSTRIRDQNIETGRKSVIRALERQGDSPTTQKPITVRQKSLLYTIADCALPKNVSIYYTVLYLLYYTRIRYNILYAAILHYTVLEDCTREVLRFLAQPTVNPPTIRSEDQ